MLGRTNEGIAFPAVLLALASLGAGGADHVAGTAMGPEAGVERLPTEGSAPLCGSCDAGPSVAGGSFLALSDGADVGGPGGAHSDAAEVTLGIDLASERLRSEQLESGLAAELPASASVDTGGDDAGLVLWTMVDTVTLDPQMLRRLRGDFVARLERVAERMWNEHGMRVELVEGYRTPQRQRELFAQGRTEEGPVVTWTRNSLHSAGAAADLHVNGSPVTPEQAVLLSRVAREEGLRTLYPFDSGHIQMEGVTRRGAPEAALPREAPASPLGPPKAQGVAPVAPVARPARPARPGGMAMGDAGSGDRPSPVSTGTDAPSRSTAPEARATATSADAQGSRVEAGGLRSVDLVASGRGSANARGGESGGDSTASGSGGEEALKAGARSSGSSSSAASSAGTGAAGAAAGAGTAASEGGLSAAVQALRPEGPAAAASRPEPMVPTMAPSNHMARLESAQGTVYRRLHLPIDGLSGPASLHLGVRGGTVDASLTLSDPVLATDLRQSLLELRQALASRGIETGGLAIRVVPDAAVRGPTGIAEASTVHSDPTSTSTPSDARSSDGRHSSGRNGDPRLSDNHDDGAPPRKRDGGGRRHTQERQ